MSEGEAEEKKIADLYFGYNNKTIKDIDEDLKKLATAAEKLNGKLTINVDSKSMSTLNANLDKVLNSYKLKVKEGATFSESTSKSIAASAIKYANKAVIQERAIEAAGNKQIEIDEKLHQNTMEEIVAKRRTRQINFSKKSCFRTRKI